MAVTVAEILFLFALFVQSRIVLQERKARGIPKKMQLVNELELTDLAMWTEARYTRHPSQADYFSAFQDCPSSLEHFPAGSVVTVPEILRTPRQAGPGEGD